MTREWQYYTGPGGGNIVVKEIAKCGLSKQELARLEALLDRYSEGRTFRKDYKPLRDGICELRLSGDRRDFRLYFAESRQDLVLLALHFAPKKSQVDKEAIDLAADRLKEWHRRQ